jgi:hypothetical protein
MPKLSPEAAFCARNAITAIRRPILRLSFSLFSRMIGQ